MLLLLLLLLGAVVTMAGIYAYATIQARYYQEYRNLSDILRSSSQQMDKYAGLAAGGDISAFSTLKKYRDRFDQAILQLQGGNPETGLPALSGSAEKTLEKITFLWRKYRNSADTILAYQDNIYQLQESLQTVDQELPALSSISEEIASSLVQRGGHPRQVHIATRQLMLLERIRKNLQSISAGGDRAVGAMEQFDNDLGLFARVVNGMLSGDQDIGVMRVRSGSIRQQLEQLSSLVAGLDNRKNGLKPLCRLCCR